MININKYMPRSTNGALRHGILYNAKYGLSYLCMRAGCPNSMHLMESKGCLLCVVEVKKWKATFDAIDKGQESRNRETKTNISEGNGIRI